MAFHKISEVKEGTNILVYGQPGVGKTKQAELLAKAGHTVLLINVEAGTLSLDKTVDGLFVEDCRSTNDLRLVLSEIMNDPNYQIFDCIVLDSISEIAEIILSEEKEKTKDGRMAYGQMKEILFKMVRAFKYLKSKGLNVIFCAKSELKDADGGRVMNAPACPGKTNGLDLAYEFDTVLPMFAEAKTDDNGNVGVRRFFVTQSTNDWIAKVRTTRNDIPMIVESDLNYFIDKKEGK